MAKDILNFNREELAAELAAKFELEAFRARQIFPWIYKQRLREFDPMTDISKAVRDQLKEHFEVSRPTLEQVQQSVDGTRKYLFSLKDSPST